jgi:HKD family nuclease
VAKKEFILQGFTKRTHAAAARELFDVVDIQRVLISVAFVSESGVRELEQQLTATKGRVVVLAGIRNDITSMQGLDALRKIVGDLFTVDTGSRMVLFHPKLYLVRGKTHARLLVGSANLTLGGLNNNIEAGMLIEFDLTDDSERAIVVQIEGQLLDLSKEYPEHVEKVKSKAALDDLLASGRIVDEMALPPPRPATAAPAGKSSDMVTRIKLKVPAIRRALAKAKAAAKKPVAIKPVPTKAVKGVKAVAPPVPAAQQTVGVELELVWESKPLAERDLNIPSGANTHATGSINLDKGLLDAAVDHRHYFRDEVFNLLLWSASIGTQLTEEAYAKFQLVLKGISYGEFDLKIAHSTNAESRTYQQRNAMTRLSWGPARTFVGRQDLIGRTLALYRDKVDPTRFVLEID